jgi:tRNA(Arg) A34 adenosine deaminase TadA
MQEQAKIFLGRAVELCMQHIGAGYGGPFGALIVKDGRIISEGINLVISSKDPTAHAEITAIREACKKLNTFSLEGCTIYSSCEPCPMCLSAIYWARIGEIYYAADSEDAAAAGFDDAFLYKELKLPQAEHSIPAFRINIPEAKTVFERWCKSGEKIVY